MNDLTFFTDEQGQTLSDRFKKIIKNKDEIKKVVVNQKDVISINTIIANSAYELGEFNLSKDYYSRNYVLNSDIESLYRIIIIDNKIEDINDIKLRFNFQMTLNIEKIYI